MLNIHPQNNRDMNRKQFRKQVYIRPTIKVIVTEQGNLLFGSGQHKDAENGGSYGDAKQGIFFDDEEEYEEENTSWGI